MDVHEEVKPLYDFWKSTESVYEQGIHQWEGSYWFKAITDHEIKSVKMSFEGWEETYIDPPLLISPIDFLGKFLGVSIRSPEGGENQVITPYFSCYTAEDTNPDDIDGPVFLSEGIMDAEAISRFHFPSFACLKSIPSYFTIGMLDAISDKIVFVPDNDKAGEKAKNSFVKKCVKMDRWIDFEIIDLTSIADPGELFQFGFDSREALLFEQQIYSEAESGW